MVTLGRKNAAERVASLLLLFATRSADTSADDADSATFYLPVGRADMADFLGVTIETVSRQISKLRHDGIILISSHRHVVIPDLPALRSRTGYRRAPAAHGRSSSNIRSPAPSRSSY